MAPTQVSTAAVERPGALGRRGSRAELFRDLALALETSSPPGVLAVFDLCGQARYVELYGRLEAEILLNGVARRLADALGTSARCYRPRREELAALLSEPIDAAQSVLTEAVRSVEERFALDELTLSYGAAVLPEEADDPIDALILADERLALSALAKASRERRQICRA